MANLSVIYRIAADISGLKSEVEKGVSIMEGMAATAATLGTALAGTFTIREVANFTSDVIKLGDHLSDLHDRTGISISALQDLKEIAEESGNTLEQVTHAVSQFQRRLAGGSDSAVSALNELNLSMSTLRAETPEQQFYDIAEAISKIDDPAKQAQLAYELFGRGGAEILGVLKAKIEEIRDATVKMADDTATSLGRMSDMWTRFKNNVKTVGAEVVVGVVDALSSSDAGVERQIAAFYKSVEDAIANVPHPKLPMLEGISGPMATPDTSWIKDYNRGIEALIQNTNEQSKAQREADKITEHLQHEMEAYAESVHKASVNMHLGVYDLNSWEQAIPPVQTGLEGVEYEADILANDTLPDLGTMITDNVVRLGGFGQQVGVFKGQLDQARGATENWHLSLGKIRDMGSQLASMFSPDGLLSGVLSAGFNAMFGPSGIITKLIQKGVEKLVGIAWDGIKKIGGFFKNLFGGPDADELAGRELVAKFESNFDSVEDMINKVGDAVRAAGGTSEDAQALIKAMWDAEKNGAAATQIAIQKIIDILHKVPTNLDVNINVHTNGPPDLGDVIVPKDIPNVPIDQMASGGMGHATGPRLFYTRGNEDYAFSGEGRSFGGGGNQVIQLVVDKRVLAEVVKEQNDSNFRLRRKFAAA